MPPTIAPASHSSASFASASLSFRERAGVRAWVFPSSLASDAQTTLVGTARRAVRVRSTPAVSAKPPYLRQEPWPRLRAFFSIILPLLFVAIPTLAQPQPILLDDKSSVDQILDALHARGQGLKDFAGDVSIVETDNMTGEATTLRGHAWFQDQGEGNSRLRVAFNSKQVGDKAEKAFKQEYLLEKSWLTDRDYKRKKEVARQVLKPGQKVNLLKLGEGPFPLPIGQPREEVLKLFEAKRIDTAKDDPQSTVHVELTPKPGSQFARKFKRLDVFVDTKTNFPKQINTIDPRETGVRSTDLSKITVNVGVTDKDFKLDDITDDWERKTEPMNE